MFLPAVGAAVGSASVGSAVGASVGSADVPAVDSAVGLAEGSGVRDLIPRQHVWVLLGQILSPK